MTYICTGILTGMNFVKVSSNKEVLWKVVSQHKGQYFGNNVSLFAVAFTYLSSGVLLEEEKVPWQSQCFLCL